ncbi:MAG: DNA primase [Candidatus Bipolaricaulia bacterium]
MATKEELRLIRERADMAGLLSRYLTLKRSGKNYIAICPFHPDKRPSLVIDPERKLFHCFGCGEGGDIFKFLMKIERLSFGEAVERLAQETGVELAARRGESGSGSGRLARLYELNERAAAYFEKNLQAEAGAPARAYLQERGISPETARAFRLGYALPGWDTLRRRLARTEEEAQLLSQLGLLLQRQEGGYFDRFRDRLIFPVCDQVGRVIGFAGRLLREREEEPKYLNISNTPLFTKGATIYGLQLARQVNPKELILVEGYLDAITLQQGGFKNAVATMGTALTDQQAQLLRRYVERVILAYDRDLAGEAATLRGMRSLRNAGLDVQVALLPSGEDPDSLVRTKGKEAFQAVLEGALPFHKFYIAHLVGQAKGPERDPFQIERLLAEAGSFISGLVSRPLRHELIRGLAEGFGLSEEEVELEVTRHQHQLPLPRPRREVAVAAAGVARGGQSRPWGPEEHLLYFLLAGDLSIEEAKRELSVQDFTRYGRIVEAILARSGGGQVEPEELLAELEEPDQRVLTGLLLSQVEFTDRAKAVQDALRALKLSRLEQELKELKRQLVEAEGRGEREVAERLLREWRAKQLERQGALRQG